MRFHSKYHKFSHHTLPTVGYPDSASDPIGNYEYPFKGDLVIDGGVSSDTLSADTIIIANTISTLSINTLTLVNGFANNTNGSSLINVNADTLDNLNSSDFIQTSEISSTIAPLIPSGNAYGYEVPAEVLPYSTIHRDYHGFFDFNASGALSSVSLTADVPNIIENDNLGLYTLTGFGPTSVGAIWDESINRFDFSDLAIGDMIDIRVDVEITTSIPSQLIQLDLVLAEGTGNEYRVPFIPQLIVKTSGATVPLVKYNGIYIGNNDTLNNGAYFEIVTDGNATLKVNGWYCKITRLTI